MDLDAQDIEMNSINDQQINHFTGSSHQQKYAQRTSDLQNANFNYNQLKQ